MHEPDDSEDRHAPRVNGDHVVATFLRAGQLNGKPQPEQKGKERVELVDDEKLHDVV